jgi:hypothetical protein
MHSPGLRKSRFLYCHCPKLSMRVLLCLLYAPSRPKLPRKVARPGCWAFSNPQPSGGFTFLTVLFLVALMGAGLVSVSQFWHIQAKREKEAELLFIGNQFRRSIGAYYERSPGAFRQFPKQLSDLVRDPRFPDVQRHLRKVYADPMTGKAEWALMRGPDGGIIGVHSVSTEKPLKVAGFTGLNVQLADSTAYRDWKFAYLPADPRGMAEVARSLEAAGLRLQPLTVQTPGAPLQSPFADPDTDPGVRQARCAEERGRQLLACGAAAAQAGRENPCVAEAMRKFQACVAGS